MTWSCQILLLPWQLKSEALRCTYVLSPSDSLFCLSLSCQHDFRAFVVIEVETDKELCLGHTSSRPSSVVNAAWTQMRMRASRLSAPRPRPQSLRYRRSDSVASSCCHGALRSPVDGLSRLPAWLSSDRAEGIEPSRPEGHRLPKPARLPIPPRADA